ncbi:MAG: hypothetical protein HONBIEJF_00374 [Fimbriimonadaceae bacterium]|nr:hypothetical protein [Fimbriimonadaceae bacterium]
MTQIVVGWAMVSVVLAAFSTDWVGTYKGQSIVDESIINPRYDGKQQAEMRDRIPKIRKTRLTLTLRKDMTCVATSEGGAVTGRNVASGTWKTTSTGVLVTLKESQGKVIAKPRTMKLVETPGKKILTLNEPYGPNSKVIFRPTK